MKKSPILFLLPGLLLAACVPLSTLTPEPLQIAITESTPTALPEVPPLPFLTANGRVIVRTGSYTILTEDPARTLAVLQAAVEKAGGYVTSASSSSSGESSSYSSMNARVPADALASVRKAVLAAADLVQYQSFYVSDVTTEYQKLLVRQAELADAQDQIWQQRTGSNDPHTDANLRIIGELLDSEMQNVENQLENYRQQAAMASLDVTMNLPSPAPVILE